MAFQPLKVVEVLDRLEGFYGQQAPRWPVDPYEFLIWWHCGYPASDDACARGWEALKQQVGIEPSRILRASEQTLAMVLKAGGMVPELRAMRMHEIAQRVENEFGGDLRSGLKGPLKEVRKALKRFPGIADPGADRISLFVWPGVRLGCSLSTNRTRTPKWRRCVVAPIAVDPSAILTGSK